MEDTACAWKHANMKMLVHGTDNHVHVLDSCMFGHIDPFKGIRLKTRVKVVTWNFDVDWTETIHKV